MKVLNYKALPESIDTCCVKTKIKELINEAVGKSNINIKFFEMDTSGYSPLHTHRAQHRIFVTDGEGVIFNGEKTVAIRSGDVIWTGTNEPHQIKATGKEPLKFIALTLDIEK